MASTVRWEDYFDAVGNIHNAPADTVKHEIYSSSQPPLASAAPDKSESSHRPLHRTASLLVHSSSSNRQPLAQLSQSCVNAPPSSQVSSVQYRLPWGKHKGKVLSEVPVDYVSWLKNSPDAYKSNISVRQAVDAYFATVPAATVPTVSSQPARSQQPAMPDAAKGGLYVLRFGKHAGQTLEQVPASYVAWLKTGSLYQDNAELRQAVEDWEKVPRVYVLCFGKYKGNTLDEVPPSYINWLKEFGAPDEHEDLKKALAEHRSNDSADQVAMIEAASSSLSKRKKKAWVIPPESTNDYRRFFYNGDRKSTQMWIGCHDVVRYFGADPKAMVKAGLRPHHRSQRFWLHQVFSYAQYYGTTKGETPTKALNKFKAKNYNG